MYDFEKLNSQQEIYDYVCEKLWEQGITSIMDNDKHDKNSIFHTPIICAYRGNNGTKCAIGFLIPDELYDVKFEKKSISDSLVLIISNRNATLGKFIKDNILFLSDIQCNLHDSFELLKDGQSYKDFLKINSTKFANSHDLVPYAFSD